MQLTDRIMEEDKRIFDLYRKLENTKTPCDQRELKDKIDEALDRRLNLMEAEKEMDLATF